jgi:hypothetical protein
MFLSGYCAATVVFMFFNSAVVVVEDRPWYELTLSSLRFRTSIFLHSFGNWQYHRIEGT